MDADDKHLEALIEAAAAVLELPVDVQWLPTIRANLRVTLRMGAEVAAFPLPDEAEPASVFEA